MKVNLQVSFTSIEEATRVFRMIWNSKEIFTELTTSMLFDVFDGNSKKKNQASEPHPDPEQIDIEAMDHEKIESILEARESARREKENEYHRREAERLDEQKEKAWEERTMKEARVAAQAQADSMAEAAAQDQTHLHQPDPIIPDMKYCALESCGNPFTSGYGNYCSKKCATKQWNINYRNKQKLKSQAGKQTQIENTSIKPPSDKKKVNPRPAPIKQT
jgi:hypothetical protein